MSETDLSIFEATLLHAGDPKTYTSLEIALTELGYSVVSPEDSEEDIKAFDELYRSTVTLVEDTQSMFGEKTIVEDARINIPPPKIRLLEKDGKRFFELTFNNSSKIITQTEVQHTKMGLGLKRKGLPVEHIFVAGKDNTLLDLTTTHSKKCLNLLTFEDMGSGFSQSRVYIKKGEEEDYPDTILLSMPIDTQNNWNFSDFKYLYLHENSHMKLTEHEDSMREKDPDNYYDQRPNPIRERDTNAVALQLARQVVKSYKTQEYLNLDEHHNWIENQLKSGYDFYKPYEDVFTETLVYPKMREAASNENRKIIRQKQ